MTANIVTVSDLPPNHYLIPVNRGPLPAMPILEELFPGDVSLLYSREEEWRDHSKRKDFVGAMEGEVVIYVHDFGFRVNSWQAIVWATSNGYFPANLQEAVAVGCNPQTRDLQLQNDLIALGSYNAYDCEDVYVESCPVLTVKDGKRCLVHAFSDSGEWKLNDRFLFVRKPA